MNTFNASYEGLRVYITPYLRGVVSLLVTTHTLPYISEYIGEEDTRFLDDFWKLETIHPDIEKQLIRLYQDILDGWDEDPERQETWSVCLRAACRRDCIRKRLNLEDRIQICPITVERVCKYYKEK